MITYQTNKLQKVVLGGGCVQNGTPTPDTPMDIVCNNGAIKYNPNLHSVEYHDKILREADGISLSDNNGFDVSAMVDCTTVKSFMVSSAPTSSGRYRLFQYASDKSYLNISTVYNFGDVVTLPNSCRYFRIQYGYTGKTGVFIYDSSHDLGIYTDGIREVVTDNLGNTANAEMLLAVGDYIDKQSVLNGVVTRNVGIKVLDGTETSFDNDASATLTNYRVFRDSGFFSGIPTPQPWFVTHFTTSNSIKYNVANQATRYNGKSSQVMFCISESALGINSSATQIQAISAFKQWLATQYKNGTPVIIVYPLAEPTTEQVTPQPLAGNSVTQTAGSIDNLPIESSTIAELKKRYIGDKEVKRVYIGDNLVWKNN